LGCIALFLWAGKEELHPGAVKLEKAPSSPKIKIPLSWGVSAVK
jgi:hypothetical protein